jgi:hypothetical protein
MSEYVEIRSSAADILNIANRLRNQGTTLNETLTATANRITGIEEHPETLPPDKFTDGFTKSYLSPVEGADGVTSTANEAVKQSAVQMGTVLKQMGDSVVNAMWAYSGTDDDNATDVNSANRA